MTAHVLSLLNEAGKNALMSHLVSAFPALKDVAVDAFEKELNNAYQKALGSCNSELVYLEAVYADNNQLYGGDSVEVPYGTSVFLPAIEEVLNTRWLSGNEFSTTEIHLKRRGVITDFSIIGFKEAFFHARAVLANRDDEMAKVVCGILAKALDPLNDKTSFNAQTVMSFFDKLDSSSSEEDSKADGPIEGFMETQYSSEDLAQYLIEVATRRQFADYPDNPLIADPTLGLFQVACAIRTMGLTFEDYLEA